MRHVVIVANTRIEAVERLKELGIGKFNSDAYTMVLTSDLGFVLKLRSTDGAQPGVELAWAPGWENGIHWKQVLNMLVYHRFTQLDGSDSLT